jgi:hypothetical protein
VNDRKVCDSNCVHREDGFLCVHNRLSIKSSEESVEIGYIDLTIATLFNKLRLKYTKYIYWRSQVSVLETISIIISPEGIISQNKCFVYPNYANV